MKIKIKTFPCSAYVRPIFLVVFGKLHKKFKDYLWSRGSWQEKTTFRNVVYLNDQSKASDHKERFLGIHITTFLTLKNQIFTRFFLITLKFSVKLRILKNRRDSTVQHRAGRIALWNRSIALPSSLLSKPAFWECCCSIRKRAKSEEGRANWQNKILSGSLMSNIRKKERSKNGWKMLKKSWFVHILIKNYEKQCLIVAFSILPTVS